MNGTGSLLNTFALKIHLSQIPNKHHRHTDYLFNSTHKIHHTRRYRILSSQQKTATDNASPGTVEEIDELLNALVLSQFSYVGSQDYEHIFPPLLFAYLCLYHFKGGENATFGLQLGNI
jgi:hypothetical protein